MEYFFINIAKVVNGNYYISTKQSKGIPVKLTHPLSTMCNCECTMNKELQTKIDKSYNDLQIY